MLVLQIFSVTSSLVHIRQCLFFFLIFNRYFVTVNLLLVIVFDLSHSETKMGMRCCGMMSLL